MNTVKYNNTDPIWIKFTKFCNTLSPEDKRNLLKRQKNFFDYLMKEQIDPHHNPLVKAYFSVLKEEYVNDFPLTKQIYNIDFKTNPYFTQRIEIWGRLLPEAALEFECGKGNLTSILLNCENLVCEYSSKNKDVPFDFYKSFHAIFAEDKELIKEWEENGVDSEEAKTLLSNINSFLNTKHYIHKWIIKGAVEFEYNNISIPFNKIFTDKLLIKIALHACYVELATRKLY